MSSNNNNNLLVWYSVDTVIDSLLNGKRISLRSYLWWL